MVKTLVWSVVMYGSETWTLRKEDTKRLEALEMWIWRRMEKISWREHKTNAEVLQQVGEKRTMIETIRNRQRKWMGHILRSDNSMLKISRKGWRQEKEEEDRELCYWTG